jgi:rare lipoprotein A
MSHINSGFSVVKIKSNLLKRILFLFLLLGFVHIAEAQKATQQMNGVASFYAKKFNGRPTATGEIFKHSNLTAASNFFKFHTWVRITNLLNGKSVVVRINDRMHPAMAKKGRVVDLTTAAAKELGCAFTGLIKVMVEKVPLGSELSKD